MKASDCEYPELERQEEYTALGHHLLADLDQAERTAGTITENPKAIDELFITATRFLKLLKEQVERIILAIFRPD